MRIDWRLRLPVGGAASKRIKKGRAFPHCAAAEPRGGRKFDYGQSTHNSRSQLSVEPVEPLPVLIIERKSRKVISSSAPTQSPAPPTGPSPHILEDSDEGRRCSTRLSKTLCHPPSPSSNPGK